mgnify:CR=1 FL=1
MVVALSTTVTAAVAILSFNQTESAPDVVTESQLPALVASQRLAADSGAFVATLPVLQAAKQRDQLERALRQAHEQLDDMRQRTDELAALGADTQRISQLRDDVVRLEQSLAPQQELLAHRIDLDQRRQAAAGAIAAAHGKVLALLGPMVAKASADLTEVGTNFKEMSGSVLDQLSSTTTDRLAAVLTLRADLNLVLGQLARVALAPTKEAVEQQRAAFTAASSASTTALSRSARSRASRSACCSPMAGSTRSGS